MQNISIAWLLTSLCNFNLRCRNVENQNKEKGSEAEHCDEKNWISMSHDPDVFSWLFVWKLSRGGAWQLAVCSPFTVVNFVKRAIIDETWDPFVCNHALNWTSIPVPSERDQKWPRWGEEISPTWWSLSLLFLWWSSAPRYQRERHGTAMYYIDPSRSKRRYSLRFCLIQSVTYTCICYSMDNQLV